MQLGGIGILLAICLFFLGLPLMILIIARYVPQWRMWPRLALSRESIDQSDLPIWVRMIGIPTLASALPVLLPFLVCLVDPAATATLYGLFGETPFFIVFVFAVSCLGYHWRRSLPYYRDNQNAPNQV